VTPTDLKCFAPFADLGEEELEMLADLIEVIPFHDGQTVIQEGVASEGLQLLFSGRIAVSSRDQGDLGNVEAPTVLGQASLVAVGPRELSGTALGEGEMWLLSRTAFHRFAEDSPRAAVRVLEAITRELAALLRATGGYAG
jgi:CRP-like cAMP-binding protein